MENNYRNTSTIIKAPYNAENPYTVVSNNWNNHSKLNGFERAIMLELMSNSSDFIINKTVVQKRLQFPRQKFFDAWDSLVAKHFILCDKKQKLGVHWVINESNTIPVNSPDNTTRGNPSCGNPSRSILTSNNIISNKINKGIETILPILTNTLFVADATNSILDQDAIASIPIHIETISLLSNIDDDFNIEFNTDMEQY